jgi:hypothetical protein
MAMQEREAAYVFYVKAWKTEKDFHKERPPEAHYLYHSEEGRALEVTLNVMVRFGDVNALKTHLLHKFRKLEYGMAPPDEWDRAMAAHSREYGDALREQGKVDETQVVVRSGSGRRKRRR